MARWYLEMQTASELFLASHRLLSWQASLLTHGSPFQYGDVIESNAYSTPGVALYSSFVGTR